MPALPITLDPENEASALGVWGLGFRFVLGCFFFFFFGGVGVCMNITVAVMIFDCYYSCLFFFWGGGGGGGGVGVGVQGLRVFLGFELCLLFFGGSGLRRDWGFWGV